MRGLRAYLATLAAMLALDFSWLSVMGGFYRRQLGVLLSAPPDMIAAALFYLVYVAGVVGFVILPARDWRSTAARGGGFGLVAYATYDLTNRATLVHFSWSLAGADMAWGVIITGLSATAGYAVCRKCR